MKITIDYEASWRNSFLDPATNNNEALPKKGRKFVGSITSLNKKGSGNYIKREITLDTVMGILNRLIGDQRKLYQARAADKYYFREIEPQITFKDIPVSVSKEMIYLRNISGNTDQNSYSGMIKTKAPIFCSSYSKSLWGVLSLEGDEIFDFVLLNTPVRGSIDLDPLSISSRLEEVGKYKAIEHVGRAKECVDYLARKFPDLNCLNPKGLIRLGPVYFCSLYLQIERLKPSYDDLSNVLSKSGRISGISSNTFTKKNFMGKYTTGGEKKVWGNPYIYEDYAKGEGKTTKLLTKASGKLEINLDISREQANIVKQDIENAGVSSFYLGKKGLAYVSDIRV